MASELFIAIAKMSLFGTLALLVVCLLLVILDWLKAPKRMSALMCLVVAVRLLCPAGIPLPFGLFRLSPVESAVNLVQRTPDSPVGDYEVHIQGDPAFDRAVEAGVIPQDDNIISIPVVITKPDSTVPAERASEKKIPLLLWIWLAGFLGMAGYGIISYWMLKRKIADAVKCPQLGNNVYFSDRIPGPFVCGVVRPKIYLPLTIREGEMDYILLHERTHIRRGDHLVKILYYLSLCVHWFNPFVWSFQKIAAAQMEFACDEAVLKKMGTDISADYSRSILNLAVGRKIVGSPLAFGENSPKERVQNILKYKKPALIVIGIAAVLCIAAVVICMASPRRNVPQAEAVVYSNLQAEVIEEKDGIISGRIITDCPAGEAGTEVFIRRNDEKKGNWLDDVQRGEWLNIGYQAIEYDRDGGPGTYVALDMDSMDEYVSTFTLYRTGAAVQHNALYNSFVNMQLPSLLLNSYDTQECTRQYPEAEEFLRVEIGEGGFRVYFVYQEDGKYYVEHPMDYRSQISQETYDSLMGYLDKKEIANRSGDIPPEPVELTMEEKRPEISLGDTGALVKKAQGGQPLTWEDFEGYADSGDVGSGIYIVSYPVEDEENLFILVGAMEPGGALEYAYLTDGDTSGEEQRRIDLTKCTYEEWEDFVAAPKEPPVVPAETVLPTEPVSSQVPAAPEKPLTYFGAEVLEAYSYNPAGYTYHKIDDRKQLETALNLLESGKTAAPKDGSEGGFLLLTSTGREEIYIDSQEKELLTLCRNNNAAQPGLIQWLVFMNPEKIDDIKFESEQGRDSWAFWTGEDQAVLEASGILKGIKTDNGTETQVERDTDGGGPNTGDYSVCSIRFNTGVSYRVELRENRLGIYSSDMRFALHYQLPKGEYDNLLRRMRQVYEKKPAPIRSVPLKAESEEVESIQLGLLWEEESFSYSGKEPEKIRKICEIMRTSEIYMTGEQIIYEDPDGNPNTGSYNGFDLSIKFKDGSESWLMRDRDGRLDVFGRGETYEGYAFYQVDHREIWEKMYQVIK